MSDKLLTIREVAQYLGRSEQEIERLVNEGRLPGYRIGGEYLRFRKDQVDAIRRGVPLEKIPLNTEPEANIPEQASVSDRIRDFFYFYDFYLIAFAAIAVSLVLIYRLLQS